jgi:hypothetical protein
MRSWVRPLVLSAGAGVLFLLLFARGVERGLNHDEHQFIAPAALWAEQGLIPYRDFPLFHVPNLTFLYGAFFWITDHKLLVCRVLNVIFGWITILLVARYTGWNKSRDGKERGEAWGAAIVSLLFASDPLFLHASGKVWNHDLPTLLVVGAGLILMQAGKCHWSLYGVAGVFAGLAVGTRLTIAPIAASLAGFCFFVGEGPWRLRFRDAMLFSLGCAVAMVPTIVVWAQAPSGFIFGNLEFPRLGLLDPTNDRIQKTMVWWRKLRYFGKEIVCASWPVFLAFGVVGIPGLIRSLKAGGVSRVEALLIIVVIPAALLGCFLPSRYQYQHYYIVLPLVLLAVGHGIRWGVNRWVLTGLAGLSLLSALFHGRGYSPVFELLRPADWATLELHRLGEEIQHAAGPGKILTLAPTYPLEGGALIYPEFATAPFGWRSASLVSSERRPGLKLVAPADLETFLAENRPAGILVGFEDQRLERPLVDYARGHGYTLAPLTRKKAQLWLAPNPAF